MRRCLRSACLLVLVWLFPACSRQKTAPESSREKPSQPLSLAVLNLAADLSTKPGNAFQATFTDKVVKADAAAFLKSIRSISSDNSTFVFDPSDAVASRLQEGSILFVPGIAMRKVDIATKQDGNLVVVTEEAPLLEAFKDANIKWSAPVRFALVAQSRAESVSPAPPGPWERMLGPLQGTVYADGGAYSLSGEDDGWAYTVKASPLPDRLNLDLDVSRKYNGLAVKVTGTGSVQNFETAATIKIKDSQLK
jgi:hypothetical protein